MIFFGANIINYIQNTDIFLKMLMQSITRLLIKFMTFFRYPHFLEILKWENPDSFLETKQKRGKTEKANPIEMRIIQNILILSWTARKHGNVFFVA